MNVKMRSDSFGVSSDGQIARMHVVMRNGNRRRAGAGAAHRENHLVSDCRRTGGGGARHTEVVRLLVASGADSTWPTARAYRRWRMRGGAVFPRWQTFSNRPAPAEKGARHPPGPPSPPGKGSSCLSIQMGWGILLFLPSFPFQDVAHPRQTCNHCGKSDR